MNFILRILLTTAVSLPMHGFSQNLIENYTPGQADVIAGNWTKAAEGLRCDTTNGARLIISRGLPQNYDLSLEFTRTDGPNTVGLLIPVGKNGEVSPALELSGWKGEAHGLSRVDGLPVKSPQNPTSLAPGTLENGKRYRLDVEVRSPTAKTAEITAKLDGKDLFNWTGALDRLQPNLFLKPTESRALILAATGSEITFHSLLIEPKQTAPTPGTAQPGTLAALAQSGTPGWEPFNGARFQAGEPGVIESIPSAGAKDRGAFLKDGNLSAGTIEVELKGSAQPQSSFLGVVFHGKDGETYDSVYFRPFNFGSSDPLRRGHAVQYMSHPDFPWNELRRDRPEEFENPANPEPKPTDWFHARIDFSPQSVQVYIDQSKQPCLDIGRPGGEKSGKVGLWFNGIAAFRNFSVLETK